MVGMNAVISNNVLLLLKQNGKKQNDLAEALGIEARSSEEIVELHCPAFHTDDRVLRTAAAVYAAAAML